MGNFYFTTPAKPFVGNWEVPFVIRWEFPIPCTRGFAARAGIGPSLQISMMGLAQYYSAIIWLSTTETDEPLIRLSVCLKPKILFHLNHLGITT